MSAANLRPESWYGFVESGRESGILDSEDRYLATAVGPLQVPTAPGVIVAEVGSLGGFKILATGGTGLAAMTFSPVSQYISSLLYEVDLTTGKASHVGGNVQNALIGGGQLAAGFTQYTPGAVYDTILTIVIKNRNGW